MDTLHLRVIDVADEAQGVRSFALAPASGDALPAFEPGAHIDVHLGPGLTRQYSLTNGPCEPAWYRIAVKLEPQSRGGSARMHALRVGDSLNASPPRNHFPLSREAQSHLLLAGGIGITPLLSMAKHLHDAGRPFQLHYFARTPEHAAFGPWLRDCDWRDRVTFHHGLGPDGQRTLLRNLLAAPAAGAHVSMCGPGPFMDMVGAVCSEAGWDAARVHCEYFSAPAAANTSGDAFELVLARSGLTLRVPAEASMLDVMREAGIVIETSCEQGVCGTCVSTVLEGRPDHRDLYLSAAEQAEGRLVLPCVSRACTARLVIDR